MTTATATKISMIFNGTITLVNRETDSYITLMIKTVQNGQLKGKRILSQLVGSDNVNSYKGFAFVNNDDTIKVWRKASTPKLEQVSEIVRSLMVEGEDSRFAEKVEMKLSRKCFRCNRKLTTPESIDEGIGPICRELGAF